MAKKQIKQEDHYVVGRRPPKKLSERAEKQLKYSNGNTARKSSALAAADILFSSKSEKRGYVIIASHAVLKPKDSTRSINAKEAAARALKRKPNRTTPSTSTKKFKG